MNQIPNNRRSITGSFGWLKAWGHGVAVPPEAFGKPVVGSIPTIIRAYKSAVTYAINKLQNSRGAAVCQRNYYEHVIRNEQELSVIARYIDYNPDAWQLDRDNPDNIRHLNPPESVDDYLKDAEEMIGMNNI